MPAIFSSLSRTRPTVGRHMAVLDGLRGIALLLVVLSHFSLLGIHMIPGLDMSGTGKAGVWLFFVLSSFLLMHQCLQLDAAGRLDGRSWGRYALRRALRIYPLYIVFLLVAWLSPVQTYFGAMTATDVLAHLAMVESRWQTWSIAVEMKFYLLLPLLVLAYVHIARRSLLPATLLVVAGIGLRQWLAPKFDVGALSTYVAIFLIGSWIAIAHHHLARRAPPRDGLRCLFATVAAVTLFALLLAMTPSVWSRLHGITVPLHYWHRSFVLLGMLWGMFLLCLLHSHRWLQAAFAAPPLRLLGVVSFSAYLWHPYLLANHALLPFETGSPVLGVTLFLILVLVSAISYTVIERPFLDIGRVHRNPV